MKKVIINNEINSFRLQVNRLHKHQIQMNRLLHNRLEIAAEAEFNANITLELYTIYDNSFITTIFDIKNNYDFNKHVKGFIVSAKLISV